MFREWRGLRNTKLERGNKIMTEDKTAITEEKKVEELVEYNVAKITAERNQLREVLDKRDTEIRDLKMALAKMKDEFEGQNKSKLIDELRKVTEYGIEYLSTCSLDRLEQLIEDYKNAKRPRFQSSGDRGTYVDPYEKLHNMYKFGRKG